MLHNRVKDYEVALKIQINKLLKLKVPLSQKRLEDFYFSKVDIPNHYSEQRIEISRQNSKQQIQIFCSGWWFGMFILEK